MTCASVSSSQAAVDGDVGEVEPDDLVITADRLAGDGVEDAQFHPLVAPLARGRVGDHTSTEALRVLPGASDDEPDEHHLEAVRSEARWR